MLSSVVENPSNSVVLKPGYAPFQPRLETPPPLPSGEHTFLQIDPLPVRSCPHKRRRARSSSQSRGRKWTRLYAQDEEESEPEAVELDDLPLFDRSKEAMYPVICRRKPPESAGTLLSHGHRMVHSPEPDVEPPKSIHYDVFARMVDELVANGKLSAAKK